MRARSKIHFSQGFTLIEAMVVVVILGILLSIALPSFTQMMAKKNTVSGAEAVLSAINLARSEAIRSNRNSYLVVESGTVWCVGVARASGTPSSPCSCQPGASTVCDLLNYTVAEGKNTSLTKTGFDAIQFDAVRGFPLSKTSTVLTSNQVMTLTSQRDSQMAITITLNPVGRLKSCAKTAMAGYPACP
ncbi:GspH/FimT family pseudopilin [Deefgea rivuli]|uniref:GspH/FimT family pseudopilin n=1 Tax=Deefgea rivuli TaxID=400948 RepID=UPI000686AF11|nr:GspH/FimT family pseudopilin [Deefgea rivuli]